ncbi:MAG TPA: ArsA-related P-loop ATPase [Longimicrobiales bacterium]
MSRLLDAAGDSPFIFVVGKGGVGKTTAAGALALELADGGLDTLLISTDPAHSLCDLFGQPVGGTGAISRCSTRLLLEEFDAAAAADRWVRHAIGPVTELIERGTYLDGEDVRAFGRLALPGVDEMMAVLRLAALPGEERRVVVDTAPTGHTLRLLDAAATHEAIARALRAMADKAAAVASAMTGRAVRLSGESIIDELERAVSAYRERVLAPAAFVVVTRPGAVVAAETGRLLHDLVRRSLRVRAVVSTGLAGAALAGSRDASGAAHLEVPLLESASGCDGLRRWREHVQESQTRNSGPGPEVQAAPGGGAGWLCAMAPRVLLFAGKGGVGKSTCAAGAAVVLAETRDVLLCSTDPAGSLDDVLGTGSSAWPARLRVMQVDPSASLHSLHETYRDEVVAGLASLGITESAVLDRRVIESLWDLAPPGLDEMAAIAALLDAAQGDEMLVIDAAPTGHFLRLLEMPETALGWTRELMRVIVKYGLAGVAERASQALLDLARELRDLRSMLHDRAASAVIVVTLDEPMVRAETDRLIAALAQADVRVGAVLVNRARGGAHDSAPVGSERHWREDYPVITAPELDPPIGPDALRRFASTWNIVP